MWRMILIGVSALTLAGAVYLTVRFHSFSFIKKIAQRNKPLSWLAAAAPVGLCAVFFIWNVYTVAVVLVHLALLTALADLIFFIAGRIRGKRFGFDVRGITALILTCAVIGGGFFAAYHVFRTEYRVRNDKNDGSLRVALIADAHLGVTLDGERFAAQMERIAAEKPDVVVVVGDFVDDDSTGSDMRRACAALGELQTTLGVYFVFGNHDEGYFRYRDYTGEELRAELRKNGVTILEDAVVPLGEDFALIGRKDRSNRARKECAALLEGVGTERFTIVLDHQPNDYAAEEAAGADLVLSGHTHGGHIFPAGLIGLVIGAKEKVYGQETRGNTDFIVTSGISGWALPIKTGAHSEYVVIDIG